MSLREYDRILARQGGGCAICHSAVGVRDKRLPSGRRRLPVDHDAVTGDVRGLLCSNCNIGLGNFTHSPAILRRAAQYLELAAMMPSLVNF